MSVRILQGDCRELLKTLLDESVHCVVTSPPYWGLRDYGTATWEGGDSACDHVAGMARGDTDNETPGGRGGSFRGGTVQFAHVCGKCGATRTDAQLGLESTPAEYVERMVGVFREVRRVLRDDGTLWLNLGDSYHNGDKGGYAKDRVTATDSMQRSNLGANFIGSPNRQPQDGLKPKDLCGIPWRVAFSLQADGWVLRQEIIWGKPNPMPESVRDRCTKAHEQLFLFAKAKWSGTQGGRFAHISDQDARWLACCIDTEGCIVVKRVKQLDGGADSFAPQIAFGSTSRALIDTLVSIACHGNALERPGKNAPMYYWQISSNVARDFLHRIYPYLIVKQRQARIGIYLDSLTYYRGGKFLDRKQRTPAENAILLSLWERSKLLNKFGNPDLSDVPEPEFGRWVGGERYYFDADAIAEPTVADHPPGNRTHKGATAYANEEGEHHRTKAGLVDYAERQRESWNGSTFTKGKTATHQDGRAQSAESRTNGKHSTQDKQSSGHRIVENVARARAEGADHDNPFGTTRNKRSVWTVATKPFSEAHFATFPPALIEPCILAGCPVGGTVLDPFGGAGTTGLVADRHGRDAILIELNESYADMARTRIRGDAPLFAEVA